MVLIILVVSLFIISPYTRLIVFAAASVISIRELSNLFRKLEIQCAEWVLHVFAIGIVIMAGLSVTMNFSPVYYLAWMFLGMFFSMFEGIRSAKVRGKGAMANCGILMYPLFPYAAVTIISVSHGWQAVFVIACLATWLCDSFALFGGKWWGKHKVAPYTSPNKTIEGCLTGAASSILAGILAFFILKAFNFYVPIGISILVAFVASTFGQIGDLAASLLKRTAGIKDYSNLIPGHGGMMDRADSLLFSVPVTWFLLYITNVI